MSVLLKVLLSQLTKLPKSTCHLQLVKRRCRERRAEFLPASDARTRSTRLQVEFQTRSASFHAVDSGLPHRSHILEDRCMAAHKAPRSECASGR